MAQECWHKLPNSCKEEKVEKNRVESSKDRRASCTTGSGYSVPSGRGQNGGSKFPNCPKCFFMTISPKN